MAVKGEIYIVQRAGSRRATTKFGIVNPNNKCSRINIDLSSRQIGLN